MHSSWPSMGRLARRPPMTGICAIVVIICVTNPIDSRRKYCFAGLPNGSDSRSVAAASVSRFVPTSLSTTDWSSIGAAYEANRLAAYPNQDGFQARNHGQQWRTKFDGRGFVTTPDAGDWSWGLELVSYGAGDGQHIVNYPECLEAIGKRVEYQWDDVLTEWYINEPRGLEHGYTVLRRPSPADGQANSAAQVTNEPQLRFILAVRGDLRPRIGGDGRDVTFVNENGAAVVNYSGLKVIDADGAAVPAWFEDLDAGLRLHVDDSAARYPLTIDPTAQQAYLKASNTGNNDAFGTSVAISGDTVVVGAPNEDSSATGVNGNQASNSAPNSGAAYVFVRSDTTWTQQAYLKASNASVISSDDRFGTSVAVSGNTIVVGAKFEDSNATGVNGNQSDDSAFNSGAAYVFVRSGTTWTQQAYLKASNTGADDHFGISVAVSGDTVVVGAEHEDSNATGVNGNQADNSANVSGAAYVFVRSGTTWSQQAYLKASNTAEFDKFGWSVSVADETVVVGAYEEDSNATGVNGNQANNAAEAAGAAYVFVRSGTSWSQQAYLKASNTGQGDWFGYSVSISGDTIVVGSPFESSIATGVNGDQNNDSHPSAGAAYVFVRNGTTWTQQAYVKASNTPNLDDPFAGGDLFGVSVAVSGDMLVVGATNEDSNATGVNGNQLDNTAFDSGAAYVFTRSGVNWSQQAYLKASNSETNDFFGEPVAVSGTTVVIGAPVEDSNATGVNGNEANNGAADSGAAYVFLIEPCASTGDMNCDCAVNLADIAQFVQALVDPASFTGCNILNGDMQPDGSVNGRDVQGFVDLLVP